MTDLGRTIPQVSAHQQNLRVAVKSHRLVQLSCEDGRGSRLFAPHAIYKNTMGKICVAGYELATPRSSMTDESSRNLELVQIKALTLVSYRFNPHPSFSTAGRKYESGVICAVDRV